MASQAVGLAANALERPMGGSDIDAWGNVVDGREKFMARVVLAAVADYKRDTGTYPTLEWMEKNVYPTYEAKVKAELAI